MRHLCDSNIFVALSVSSHPNHDEAMEWFRARPSGDTLCFCRATQITYLRLLTSECMQEDVCTNDEAMEAYQALRADARFGFVSEPGELETFWWEYAEGSRSSPKKWMDAYLAAFARAARMPFVTFDRAFTSFSGLNVVLLRSQTGKN